MMDTISDNQLLEIYEKAEQYDLQKDFIRMIKEEINKRGLDVVYDKQTSRDVPLPKKKRLT